MQPVWKCVTMAAVAALAAGSTGLAARGAAAGSALTAAQQNELVQRYCAVCHNDAHMNGGLSLEHFDAARPDPGDAAMIASKLKAKAIGAAGLPMPDKTTQDALLAAMSAAATGAGEWTLTRLQHPKTKAPMLTASVVQEVPSTASDAEPDLYRLTLTCQIESHEGDVQLAWSPNVPKNGQVMSAAADERAPVAYKVEGTEKMGNGTNGTSGPGAIILYTTTPNAAGPQLAMPLPAQTLTISHLFPAQTVVFPFGKLPSASRQALSTCFAGSGTAR